MLFALIVIQVTIAMSQTSPFVKSLSSYIQNGPVDIEECTFIIISNKDFNNSPFDEFINLLTDKLMVIHYTIDSFLTWKLRRGNFHRFVYAVDRKIFTLKLKPLRSNIGFSQVNKTYNFNIQRVIFTRLMGTFKPDHTFRLTKSKCLILVTNGEFDSKDLAGY